MTSAKQLYTAPTDQAAYSPPSTGFWSDRRPFKLESYFGTKVWKDQSKTFTTLDGDNSYTLTTNAADNGSDRKIENYANIMKTSTNSSPEYACFYWNVQTNYYNMVGMGPYYGDNSNTKAFYHPNVVGATLTWRKSRGHYDAGECGFKHWGLNYYSPTRDLWRTVRFNTHSSSGNHYYSHEGDDWVHHRGDPSAFGVQVDGWAGTRGYLGDGGRNKVMNEDWLWGGFYIIGECTNRGGASHTRKLDLSDFQPIYGDKGGGARLILPFGSQGKDELKSTGLRFLRK